MVSFNHWLSSIETNMLSRYQTLVNANHALSNWAQENINLILGFNELTKNWLHISSSEFTLSIK